LPLSELHRMGADTARIRQIRNELLKPQYDIEWKYIHEGETEYYIVRTAPYDSRMIASSTAYKHTEVRTHSERRRRLVGRVTGL